MSRLQRNINLSAVFGPFLGLAIAVPLLWGDLLGPRDVAIFFALYVPIGLGVTIGYAFGGTLHAALTALVWGGFVRVAVLHHVTWSINSICHFFGRRRFAIEDHSTNVPWLALLSFGEAWHHNHHAFARSAFHGLRRWEALMDPSGWVIRTMRRTGLAWNVVEIAPE